MNPYFCLFNVDPIRNPQQEHSKESYLNQYQCSHHECVRNHSKHWVQDSQNHIAEPILKDKKRVSRKIVFVVIAKVAVEFVVEGEADDVPADTE